MEEPMDEPLQKPKTKKVYTTEQIDTMKANLAKGREAKKLVQEERKAVLDLHTKLIGKQSKAEQLKEKLENEISKIADEPVQSVVEPKVKKLPKKVKIIPIVPKEPDSDNDSVEIVIEKKPKRRVVYVEKEVDKPLPPTKSQEPPKSILRFV